MLPGMSSSGNLLLTIVRFGYAPALLLGLNGLAIAGLGAGLGVAWLLGLFALAVALSFAAERVLPYEAAWNRPQGDVGRDWAHAIVNEAAGTASIAASPLLVAAVAATGPWPAGTAASWPVWAPFPVQVLGAVLVFDMGITLAHFLSHRWSLLWRFHAVHHSVERMYGFNGLMKHPFHQAVEMMAGAGPLVLLGMPLEVAVALGFCTAVQLLLQHSNVDYELGPLTRWIAGNRVHRFHHVREAGAGDVNFGLFTTLGDRVLGTLAFDPARDFRPGDFGLAGRDDYPRAYLAQLLEPFRSPAVASPDATGMADGVMPRRRRKVRAR